MSGQNVSNCCGGADGVVVLRGRCWAFCGVMSWFYADDVIVPRMWDTCLTLVGHVFHIRGTRVPRPWDDNFTLLKQGKRRIKRVI